MLKEGGVVIPDRCGSFTGSFHVRRYRPNYCTGYENEVVRDVPVEKLFTAPDWLAKAASRDNFDRFEIEPYYDEFIISVIHKNEEKWVMAFAVRTDHEFASNWRYSQ